MSTWNFNLNSCGTLSGAHTAAQTTLTLETGHGARFANSPRKLVVFNAGKYDEPADALIAGDAEVVYQTNQASDVLTVQRGRDGTTAMAFPTGTNTTWYVCNFVDTNIAGDLVNVKALGAVGDAVADDADVIHDVLTSAPAGATVFFPAGQYNLDTWPDAGHDYNKKLTLLGEGTSSIIAGPATALFMDISDELCARDLEFTGWIKVFDFDELPASAVDSCVVESCRFGSVTDGLTWRGAAASSKVKNFVVRNCIFSSVSGVGIDMRGEWDQFVVDSCVFDTITNFGVQLGNNTPASEADWSRTKVVNSTFKGLTSSGATSRAIYCFGREVTIANNTINDVTGGTSQCQAIFCYAAKSTVTGNKIIDVDGSTAGAAHAIYMAGNDAGNSESSNVHGYDFIIANNVIDMNDTSGAAGIRHENDNVIVSNNVILGVRGSGISSDTTTSKDHSNIVIDGNVINFGTVDASSGHGIIFSHAGDNITVSNNTIDGAERGIQFTVASGTSTDRAVIGNRVDANTAGFLCNTTVSVTGIRVQNNSFANATYGIRFEGSTAPDLVQVGGNVYRSCTTNVSLGVTPTNFIRFQTNQTTASILELYNRLQLVTTATEGFKVTAGTAIIEVTQAKGFEVTAGGLKVVAGGANITGGATIVDTGLTVTAGGITVTAGGVTINGGDLTLQGGNTIYNQAGAPGAGLGSDGDFYMRTDGGSGTTFYGKEAGSWVAK